MRSSNRAVEVGWRLALTVALIYGIHFATNVVRETYPAVTLVDDGSFRVDPYVGLHPDLFEDPTSTTIPAPRFWGRCRTLWQSHPSNGCSGAIRRW